MILLWKFGRERPLIVGAYVAGYGYCVDCVVMQEYIHRNYQLVGNSWTDFPRQPGAEYGAGRHISEIPKDDILQLIKVFHTFTLLKGRRRKSPPKAK